MVVAVIFVGSVKSPLDQVIDMIVVRYRLMSAAVSMCVRWVARDRRCVAARMPLVNRDHVFVNVIAVRMM